MANVTHVAISGVSSRLVAYLVLIKRLCLRPIDPSIIISLDPDYDSYQTKSCSTLPRGI